MMESSGFDDDPPAEPRDGWLLVRIHVPELNVYKCLQFPSDRLVWDVKQQVLASLPKVRNFKFFLLLFAACEKYLIDLNIYLIIIAVIHQVIITLINIVFLSKKFFW